jgi:D-amino-acid dehydrogenase
MGMRLKTMTSNSDVLVVGGGVIGLFCAYYLSRAGRKVSLIERNKVGTGASHANCGLLFINGCVPLCAPGVPWLELRRLLKGNSPLYIAPKLDLGRLIWFLKFTAKCNPAHLKHAMAFKAAMLRNSDLHYAALFKEEKITGAAEFNKKGVLMVHKSEADMEAYGSVNRLLEPFGLAADLYQGKELNQLEPALKEDLCGGWYHKSDSHLRPEGLIATLKNKLQETGVNIREDCALKRIRILGGRVVGFETQRGTLRAGTYLLATGAWAPESAGDIGIDIPIQPGKGYSITMARPALTPEIPCYLHERNTIVTPWKSGYRLGGTMEFSGYNLELNPARLARLRSAAGEYLKNPLGKPVVEEWAGLRPMSYDDLPIIGRVPRLENLFIATGHGMLGLTLGPATGVLITQVITGAKTDLDPLPYSLERFSPKNYFLNWDWGIGPGIA